MTDKQFLRMLLPLLAMNISLLSYSQERGEEFESFLSRFTSSASFQYSRVRFPLTSPIILLDSNEKEKSFPFTKNEWQLLDSDVFVVDRSYHDEAENYYVSKYIQDDPKRKEFEAGYEESEIDLRVVFELIGDKWFVTDCYNGWYSFDLPAEELSETIALVKEENDLFIEQYP